MKEQRPETETGARRSPAPDPVQRWAREFVEDSALWPVLAVAVGTLSAFGAALLVLGFEDGNLGALGAVALLVVVGLHGGVRALRRRRLGVLGGIALAVAVLSVLGALAEHFLLAG